MPGFSIPSASGRRVDLLNPVDLDPHEMIRSASLSRMSDSVSPPPAHAAAHNGSVSPHSPSLSPRVSTLPVPEHPAVPGAGKRIYRCQDCQKVFSTSGHLTRHSKVHTGEKNHICPYPDCQRRCSRRDNLLQHYTMHLTKEERDLPTTYVREALSAMQARMGTYVHPYPRGAAPHPQSTAPLPSLVNSQASTMRVERAATYPVPPAPSAYTQTAPPSTHRYPEASSYARPENQHPTTRPAAPMTSSPSPLKRPLDIDMDDPHRPPSMRRTSSASSASTMEPLTPPMPVAAPTTIRKEYVLPLPEDRRYQVSSVRGTL